MLESRYTFGHMHVRRPSSTYSCVFTTSSTYQLPTSCLSTDDRENYQQTYVAWLVVFFLSIYMSTWPIHLSIYPHLLYPSIHLSMYPCTHLCIHESTHLYPHMRLYFCTILYTIMLHAFSINMKDVRIGACILVYIHKWTEIRVHSLVFVHI